MEIMWLPQAQRAPPNTVASPLPLSGLLFWDPPILAHVCGVGEGKCLRRGGRRGFLADPAVLSNPHLTRPPHPQLTQQLQEAPSLAQL